MDEQAGSTFVADRNGNLVTGGIRGGLDKLVRRARPRDTAADRCAAVDLIAGAIDGLGIQAVLEPASFTNARLRRAASAIVESVL